MTTIGQVEIRIRVYSEAESEDSAYKEWEAISIFPTSDLADVDIPFVAAGLLPLLYMVIEKWQNP